MPAQPFRQQRRLVKPALALFRRMQRDGNDRIETACAKELVVERGYQPARDQMAKMNLASVFKIENHVANDAAASVSRNRGVEMEDEMGAVGAGKGGGDCAVKRLGTFRAKRRHNSGNVCFAFAAKIFVQIDRRRANGARRRIEQRRDPAKKARCCAHRRISTSRALSATSSTRLRAARFRREDFFRATAV